MSTDHLVQVDPALGSDQAAGALLVRDGGGMWLLWLRTEVERTVDWGGDPRQPSRLRATTGHPGSARAPPSTDGARSSGAGRCPGAPGRSTPPSSSGPPSSRPWRAARRSRWPSSRTCTTSWAPARCRPSPASSCTPTTGRPTVGTSAATGGTCLPLPDGSRVALVLGDVAGHGSRGRRHDDPGPHQPARLRHGRGRAGGGPGAAGRPGLPPLPRRPGHGAGRVAGRRHRPPADRAGRRAGAAAGRTGATSARCRSPGDRRSGVNLGMQRPAARPHPGDGHEPA